MAVKEQVKLLGITVPFVGRELDPDRSYCVSNRLFRNAIGRVVSEDRFSVTPQGGQQEVYRDSRIDRARLHLPHRSKLEELLGVTRRVHFEKGRYRAN